MFVQFSFLPSFAIRKILFSYCEREIVERMKKKWGVKLKNQYRLIFMIESFQSQHRVLYNNNRPGSTFRLIASMWESTVTTCVPIFFTDCKKCSLIADTIHSWRSIKCNLLIVLGSCEHQKINNIPITYHPLQFHKYLYFLFARLLEDSFSLPTT